jgi:glycerol-3-phosphate acyltransferase PlsY
MSILAIVLSYLAGSIPTGLWLGQRLRGIDIRDYGSGNIGATNTMRVLGKPLGALALAGDALKGVVSVLLISRLGSWELLPLLCGLAAILGHTASIFIGFRGGKGVATGAGVFLSLFPVPTLIALAVFIVVVAVTRMVSAGSICAASALAAAMFATDASWAGRTIAVMVAVLIIWRHRSNISRIASGTESRF